MALIFMQRKMIRTLEISNYNYEYYSVNQTWEIGYRTLLFFCYGHYKEQEGPQEYIAYELVLASPAVSCVSGSGKRRG